MQQEREPWMTPALEAELKALAADGMLTCLQIQEFAGKHTIETARMKPFVDLIGLQVNGCTGLCLE